MKKIISVIVLLMFVHHHSFCQSSKVLEEGSTVTINGVELGFRIVNESSKAAGKEEFARYKLVVFVNNTDCNKFYRNEEDYATFSYRKARNIVATFYFRNANGKRFTSKEGNIGAKEWWVPIKVTERNSAGKDEIRTRRMMAGYMFRNGEHLESEHIILVPLGERPTVEVVLMEDDRY